MLQSSVKAKWDFIGEKTTEVPEIFDKGDIFEKFRLQARLGAEFALKCPKFHKLGRMLSKERGSPIYMAAKECLGSDTEDILSGMIDTAIAEGDFRSGYSRDLLIRILSYMFSGFDEVFNTEEDSEPQKTLLNLDMYVEFIRHGIGK